MSHRVRVNRRRDATQPRECDLGMTQRRARRVHEFPPPNYRLSFGQAHKYLARIESVALLWILSILVCCENSMAAPEPSQDTASLVKRLAGPSTTKAGYA